MAPRPSKSFKPGSDGGSLDAPTSRPRAHTWTKYSEAGRGQPSELEVTIDDLTVIDDPDGEPSAEPEPRAWSKYARRSMPGHATVATPDEATPDDAAPDDAVDEFSRRMVKDWVSTTIVEGRIYRRADAATMVEADSVIEEGTRDSWVEIED